MYAWQEARILRRNPKNCQIDRDREQGTFHGLRLMGGVDRPINMDDGATICSILMDNSS